MAPKRGANDKASTSASKKAKTTGAAPGKKSKGAEGGAAAMAEPKQKAIAFKLPKEAAESCNALIDQMGIDVDPKMTRYVTRVRSVYEYISSFEAESEKATVDSVKDLRKGQIDEVKGKAVQVYNLFNQLFPDEKDAWKKPPPGKADMQSMIKNLATKVDALSAALQFHHELLCAIHGLDPSASDVLASSHPGYDCNNPYHELLSE